MKANRRRYYIGLALGAVAALSLALVLSSWTNPQAPAGEVPAKPIQSDSSPSSPAESPAPGVDETVQSSPGPSPQPSEGDETETPSAIESPTPEGTTEEPAEPQGTIPGEDDLLLKMRVERVGSGEVVLKLELINGGSSHLTLIFPDAQEFDAYLIDSKSEVARWSDDKFFIQVLTEVHLSPDEVLTRELRLQFQDKAGATLELYGETVVFTLEETGEKLQLRTGPALVQVPMTDGGSEAQA